MSVLPMLDHQRSPFGGTSFSRAYTPYGATVDANGPTLGFCGQPRERVTGIYPLGSGHRCFSPVLLRFQTPDQLSPFGKGGTNAYGYCNGDPVNRWDPGGRWGEVIMSTLLNAMTARDAAKGLHQTLHQRNEIQARQRHSTDPKVLNIVKPTLTREVSELAAAIVPTLGTAAGVITLASGPALPVVGTVAVSVGLTAWGVGKIAKRRERIQSEDPYYYIKHKTGQEQNRRIAIFNEVNDHLKEKLPGKVPSVDVSYNEVIAAAEDLRALV